MNVIEVITSVMSLLALSLLIFLFALAIYFSLKVDKASVSEPDEDSFMNQFY
jgi:membrane-anchored glycerophosphoryl diester phosphodiesterase (GDPDase)